MTTKKTASRPRAVNRLPIIVQVHENVTVFNLGDHDCKVVASQCSDYGAAVAVLIRTARTIAKSEARKVSLSYINADGFSAKSFAEIKPVNQ